MPVSIKVVNLCGGGLWDKITDSIYVEITHEDGAVEKLTQDELVSVNISIPLHKSTRVEIRVLPKDGASYVENMQGYTARVFDGALVKTELAKIEETKDDRLLDDTDEFKSYLLSQIQ